MPKVKRGHAEGTKGPEETKGPKRKRNEKKPATWEHAESLSDVECSPRKPWRHE